MQEFERAYAAAYGVRHCVSCANGTDAIYIVLRMLGIGAGDEVITTAASWISTSETIGQTGATPVFVDVDEYCNIDVSQVEASDHAAKTRVHDAGAPVWPGGAGRRAGRSARRARAAPDRGLRTGAFRRAERAARGHVRRRRHVQLLSRQESRRLWRRGRHRDERRRARASLPHVRQPWRAGEAPAPRWRASTAVSTACRRALLTAKLRHLDAWTTARRQVARWYDEALAGVAGMRAAAGAGGFDARLSPVRRAAPTTATVSRRTSPAGASRRRSTTRRRCR